MQGKLVIDDILQTTVDLLHQVLGVNRCFIINSTLDHQIKYISAANPQKKQFLNIGCQLSLHFYCQLLEGNYVAYNTNDPLLAVEIREQLQQYQVKSFLIMPLIYEKSYLGAICLQYCQQEHQWTQSEINIITNITHQCAIALNHAYKYTQLQEEFKQRTAELEQERQKFETISLAKSEFLSHINHELRAPVSGIIGFARMLLQEIYGELNHKQKQYLQAISASGEHLLNLINDFLDISKIEAGKEELCLETISIEETCIESLSLVKAQATEAKLELKLDIKTQIKKCIVDQLRIKQILVNLLSNAIKFTETGSVILQVTDNNNYLYWSIIDTGIGIASEDQNKLFQPFQQIHTPIHRKHKGTGLGLALARQLARLHGGDITLISQPGKGSCFTLELPKIIDN